MSNESENEESFELTTQAIDDWDRLTDLMREVRLAREKLKQNIIMALADESGESLTGWIGLTRVWSKQAVQPFRSLTFERSTVTNGSKKTLAKAGVLLLKSKLWLDADRLVDLISHWLITRPTRWKSLMKMMKKLSD